MVTIPNLYIRNGMDLRVCTRPEPGDGEKLQVDDAYFPPLNMRGHNTRARRGCGWHYGGAGCGWHALATDGRTRAARRALAPAAMHSGACKQSCAADPLESDGSGACARYDCSRW